MKMRSDEKVTDFQNQLLKQYLKAADFTLCPAARYLLNINNIKESQIIDEFIEKMKGWL